MIDLNKIHKGMDVLTSDERLIGTVKELLGQVMFLNGAEANRDSSDVSIPMIWIAAIDDAVHLAKSHEQVQQHWQSGPKTSL